MSYCFCEKKATPPTQHKNPRPIDYPTSFEEDLYLSLSPEVDFGNCLDPGDDWLDLDSLDFDSLELDYPDDYEIVSAAEATQVFPSSVALVAALCAELRKSNTALSFLGTYTRDDSAAPTETVSVRTLAKSIKAEISAICGLHFHRVLPAAVIAGGVTVHSFCRRENNAGRGRASLGVLDVSVVQVGDGGGHTITVQFQLRSKK
ncbi:hypothetical protein B0H16DRAFT_1882983 [Mycena metata]|uniref:Uncharacterized protein n=1 Tax=Mycena metata TaxID=1033252 RepID=A0AAD7JKZ9_9AGAR|nr:hypothetical protein B0H16DRAFT_1882983 [Mycena metata]